MLSVLRSRTVEEWLSAILLTVVIALLGFQVVLRFGFGRNLSWLEEVSRYFFVWAIYFGFVIAAEQNRHIRVTFHISMLPETTQKVVLTIADMVWLAFNIVVIWQGGKMFYESMQFPYISQTTGINLAWVQLIVPLGMLFISVRVIECIVKRWKYGLIKIDTRVD
ncbi:TRAP transporter small permease [Halomonas korlensis]|uniref:TRAP transporter small permease protein n=1 Tax=Halomonas korlensis TaxID=463301 RepID=A0A1I7KJB7_9GAMM|nr:TRAP transporter small permease [Halomonas korlensis]SFU97535.1 TRAP-type C4-dicarboxylate transport system, small permease component [Halomonas korlensis]